ncbi:hypothetical protein SO802_009529 [Lithocarpus litseifolius]|uniref:F-box domain-containing protein n=1 Tax=Lithocarpus litseifolius TaxID=425828 RepID=A0AAW2DDT6_9ROSI
MPQTREATILRHRNKYHLPYDIVLNILTRLPVKSVMRLRCVSKSLDSSITSPHFISTHLNNINNKDDDDDDDHRYLIHMPVSPPPTRSINRISSTSWLPTLPLPPSEIEVYTLSSDSWRRVGIDFTTNGVFFNNNNLLTTPLVSGALHWMAVKSEEEEIRNCEMIVSFDVNSEEFRKLAQPHGSIDDNTICRCLASFKGKLAFITYGHSEQLGLQHSIWVMREYGVVESWNKLFVLAFETPSYCIAFTEYGSLLIFMDSRSSVENDKFQFLLIDTETRQEKRDPDIQYLSTVAAFMESLVLLDGANVVSY